MTVKFKVGSLYSISKCQTNNLYINAEIVADLSKSVFLCLSKGNVTNVEYHMRSELPVFTFLYIDESGNPHEFLLCEGSEYGNACQEVI